MNAIKVSSVESTPTTPLKNQLETYLDDIQAAIVSLVEAFKHHKSGRSKTQRRATHGGEGNKVPRRDKTSSKGKCARVIRPNTCNYEHGMRPTLHKAED